MMMSRYNHKNFDADLLLPNNRASIIHMLGRQE